MTTKHTPEPWRVYRADNFGRPDDKGEAVAVAGIVIGGWGVAEDMANARLIADAPRVAAEHAEMRELLTRVNQADGSSTEQEFNAWLESVRALLARIDGETA